MLVIRLFVESILRYGLPPSFIAGVIETKPKIEKKLRTILQAFGDDGEFFFEFWMLIFWISLDWFGRRSHRWSSGTGARE